MSKQKAVATPPAAQAATQAVTQASYFNLHVEGVGYLNRVRVVKPQQGKEFLACVVSALHGKFDALTYTRFDCTVRGADAQEIVKRLEPDVTAEKAVLVGFKLGDIYPELFTFEKGDKKGQQGVTIRGRLLKIKFAKVNGVSVDLPQSVQSGEAEHAVF